jgi:hypothetical protein
MTFSHTAKIQNHLLQNDIALYEPQLERMLPRGDGTPAGSIVPRSLGDGGAPTDGEVGLRLVDDVLAALGFQVVDLRDVGEGRFGIDVQGG